MIIIAKFSKLIIVSLFFLVSTKTFASTELQIEEQNIRFTPHISAEALTRKKGKFSFQRAVGANLNTSFFLSAFTYSVTNRLEFGTVLINYFVPEHKFNFNFKYNFWRGKEFFWSLGFSFFENKIEDQFLDPQYQGKGLRLGINAFQILVNYLPLNSNFKFGLNYNLVDTTILGLNDEDDELVIASEDELGLDISYALKNRPLDVTLGLGWLRQSGVSSLEDVEFGFGSSVRWYRPKKFLSSPTTGLHYSPGSGSVEFLLSSSIY